MATECVQTTLFSMVDDTYQCKRLGLLTQILLLQRSSHALSSGSGLQLLPPSLHAIQMCQAHNCNYAALQSLKASHHNLQCCQQHTPYSEAPYGSQLRQFAASRRDLSVVTWQKRDTAPISSALLICPRLGPEQRSVLARKEGFLMSGRAPVPHRTLQAHLIAFVGERRGQFWVDLSHVAGHCTRNLPILCGFYLLMTGPRSAYLMFGHS
jgi:hypothetical protein